MGTELERVVFACPASSVPIRAHRWLLRHPATALHQHGRNQNRHVLSDGGDAAGSCVTLCQDRWLHCGHVMYVRGRLVAIQRMPPNSQMDRAKPHEQRTIHARE